MAENTPGLYTLTAPVLMAFPSLLVPKAFKGKNGKDQGEPKYSANFVFKPDHPDLTPLKNLVVKIAKARWPDRDLKELALPFSSGTKLADARAAVCKEKGKEPDGEYQRGCAVINSKSKYQPTLSYLVDGRLIELVTEAEKKANQDKFYFGVEALANFNVVAYEGPGKNPDGVTIYLNAVLSLNKGKRLGGGVPPASEVFKGYAGSATTEDPTAGQDDAAGLPDSW